MNTLSETFILSLPEETLKSLQKPYQTPSTDDQNPEGDGRVKIEIIGPSEAFLQELAITLSSFEWPFEQVHVSAIGTFKDQNPKSLIPIIKNARQSNTIPIVVGFDNQVLKSSFDGFQFLEQFFSLCSVQDTLGTPDDLSSKLIELKDPYFYHLSILGSQVHRTSSEFLSDTHDLDQIRLGKLRNNISSAEPKIRNSDIFGLDLNALKYGEADNQSRPSSIGLHTEEACQLTYYAGRSERNKIFCLYGLDTEQKVGLTTMRSIASLMWYYLHGLNLRRNSYPPKAHEMTSFTIESPDQDSSFIFYKDEGEQKWWLKAPTSKDNQLAKQYPLIACDYSDYSSLENEKSPTDHVLSMLSLYNSFDRTN